MPKERLNIEQISKNPVYGWVRAIQAEFYAGLEEFGMKYGIGGQDIIWSGGRIVSKYADPYAEKTWCRLCLVANTALGAGIEEALGKNGFQVENVFFETHDRDTEIGPQVHNILRVRQVTGETNGVTIDPTLKQFAYYVQERKVPIFPSINEKKVYPGMRVIEIETIDRLLTNMLRFMYTRFGLEGANDLTKLMELLGVKERITKIF